MTGAVTFVEAPYSQSINLGDPYTLRFLVDDTDLTPDPVGGSYAAGAARLDFPLLSYTSTDDSLSSLMYVTARDTGHGILFRDDFETAAPNFGAFALIQLLFPPQTFPDDSLPLSIPLDAAALARLEMFLGVFSTEPRALASITSIASVRVPEPSAIVILGAVVTRLARRRRDSSR